MAKNKVEFKWKVPPSVIAKNLDNLPFVIENAVLLVGERNAQAMQNYARKNASWTDRTGNARSGLFAIADRQPGKVSIYLCHSMEYGLWLEIAHASRFEIIWPTILLALSRIKKDLTDVVSGRGLRAGRSYRAPRSP